ncbi:MAG TPA: hypothetical protein VH437_17640 [Terriglobales bacterium]
MPAICLGWKRLEIADLQVALVDGNQAFASRPSPSTHPSFSEAITEAMQAESGPSSRAVEDTSVLKELKDTDEDEVLSDNTRNQGLMLALIPSPVRIVSDDVSTNGVSSGLDTTTDGLEAAELSTDRPSEFFASGTQQQQHISEGGLTSRLIDIDSPGIAISQVGEQISQPGSEIVEQAPFAVPNESTSLEASESAERGESREDPAFQKIPDGATLNTASVAADEPTIPAASCPHAPHNASAPSPDIPSSAGSVQISGPPARLISRDMRNLVANGEIRKGSPAKTKIGTTKESITTPGAAVAIGTSHEAVASGENQRNEAHSGTSQNVDILCDLRTQPLAPCTTIAELVGGAKKTNVPSVDLQPQRRSNHSDESTKESGDTTGSCNDGAVAGVPRDNQLLSALGPRAQCPSFGLAAASPSPIDPQALDKNTSHHTDSPAGTSSHDAGLEESPRFLPDAGSMQATHVVYLAKDSEMRIGLRTSSFGKVEVHTTIHDKQVGVVIGSERGDLKTYLGPEVASLQANLRQQSLEFDGVRFLGGGSGIDSGVSSGPHSQSQDFPQRHSFASASTENDGSIQEFDTEIHAGGPTGLSVHV